MALGTGPSLSRVGEGGAGGGCGVDIDAGWGCARAGAGVGVAVRVVWLLLWGSGRGVGIPVGGCIYGAGVITSAAAAGRVWVAGSGCRQVVQERMSLCA